MQRWDADDFALDLDETRVFAWDKRCLESGKSRSQIWVDDLRYYYETLRKGNPDTRISLWSDMLDPAHNATLYGTLETADLIIEQGMQDIIMIPWKSLYAQQSVPFFAEKNFPLMASSQHINEQGFSEAPKWAHYIRNYYADKDVPFGLMHCNWGYAFDQDQTWQDLRTVADHAWSIAPYILHAPSLEVGKTRETTVSARIEGDVLVFDGEKVVQGSLPVESVELFYRTVGADSFKKERMQKNGDLHIAEIPAEPDDVEYYIAASDRFRTSLCPKSAPQQYFRIVKK
jgi:hypothetical protein